MPCSEFRKIQNVVPIQMSAARSYWSKAGFIFLLLAFTLLFTLCCYVYFCIIYFLLCTCNSPISPNYFGKLQLLLINPLILVLAVHLFSHLFMHLLSHFSFIIFYLFISLLLYFNPCLVLHFSCNFSKFFSFYPYIYSFSTSSLFRSFYILMGYHCHDHLLLIFFTPLS